MLSTIFFSKTVFFQNESRSCLYAFKAIQYAPVFDFYLEAVVRKVIYRIAKSYPFDFLQVGRSNTWLSVRSLVHIPKIKTQTQKCFRFLVLKMFNHLAKENHMPKSVYKNEVFQTELILEQTI